MEIERQRDERAFGVVADDCVWGVFVPAIKFLFSDLDRRYGQFCHYFDLFGMLPWWLINTIYGLTEYNPRLTKTYDACGVPAIRAAEAEIPPPTRKNLLLIARWAKDR